MMQFKDLPPFDPSDRFNITAERARLAIAEAIGDDVISADTYEFDALLCGSLTAIMGVFMCVAEPGEHRKLAKFAADYIPHAVNNCRGMLELPLLENEQ